MTAACSECGGARREVARARKQRRGHGGSEGREQEVGGFVLLGQTAVQCGAA